MCEKCDNVSVFGPYWDITDKQWQAKANQAEQCREGFPVAHRLLGDRLTNTKYTRNYFKFLQLHNRHIMQLKKLKVQQYLV